ncbi:SHD1 domain-containing protein [Novipirellula maiorica]|uniref:SHD1 domain-containing protein n=1 Tax=Novipirellula maiorica TaxID=1265734 RepID=UPI001360B149|nr:SHD1 domain-containing protein [Rhodopirellula maiorica]
MRVFYATEGPSAVPLEDTNASGTPDHVEDITKQIWAAKKLFCDVLEFPDPLTSERYPGVTCIEVYLRDREEFGGGNGAAYDESQRARKIPEGKPDDRAIVMNIGRHVVASQNITPAHEFFHLVQYGATYFKRRWFLEGQTRWSEHALGKDGIGDVKYFPQGPWPQPAMNLPTLFSMTYDAEFVLWNPIAVGTDPKGTLPLTPELKGVAGLRYSDGSPVLNDLSLTGADIMREILIELGKMDDIAFKELEYADWSEANQKASETDNYIYQAIMDTLRRRYRMVGPFQGTKSIAADSSRSANDDKNMKRADANPQPFAHDNSDAKKTLAADARKWRIWTTRDGKHKVDAKFVKYIAGTLTLQKKDGTAVDVKLDLLCHDDKEFVMQRKWTKASESH